MENRTIAIGDIHGCSVALATLLRTIEPRPDDEIIVLGDCIDRGPDSRGVLEQLAALAGRCRLVMLLGNHEEMWLGARADPDSLEVWRGFGGEATLQSYGGLSLEQFPPEHAAILERCVPFQETETHLFLHANYIPSLPLHQQPPYALRWESLGDRLPEPHISGKIAVVGHTPQLLGSVLDRGHLKCIDTFCYGGGWLTGLNVLSGQIWQANEKGDSRVR